MKSVATALVLAMATSAAVSVLLRTLNAQADTALPVAAPTTMPYEGSLAKDGVDYTGTVTIQFNLYDGQDSVTGKTIAWSETHDVEVHRGRFRAILGSGSTESELDFASAVQAGDDLYLGVTIKASGGDVSLGTQRLLPVPTAQRASAAANFTVAGKLTAKQTGLSGTLTLTTNLTLPSDLIVAGKVGAGLKLKTCDSTANGTCSCDSGYRVLSGGVQCSGSYSTETGYASTTTDWFTYCRDDTLPTPFGKVPSKVTVICARM